MSAVPTTRNNLIEQADDAYRESVKRRQDKACDDFREALIKAFGTDLDVGHAVYLDVRYGDTDVYRLRLDNSVGRLTLAFPARDTVSSDTLARNEAGSVLFVSDLVTMGAAIHALHFPPKGKW